MLFSPGWRGQIRQWHVLAFFVEGLLLGGLLTATVLWLLSGLAEPIPGPVRTGLVIAAAVAGILREFRLVRLPLPQNARQIPQDVLRHHPLLGALQFGFELGTGVRTFVSAAAPYVLAVALLLDRPGLWLTALAGLGFGAGRAVTATAQYLSHDPEWTERVNARIRPVTKITSGVMLGYLVLVAVHG